MDIFFFNYFFFTNLSYTVVFKRLLNCLRIVTIFIFFICLPFKAKWFSNNIPPPIPLKKISPLPHPKKNLSSWRIIIFIKAFIQVPIRSHLRFFTPGPARSLSHIKIIKDMSALKLVCPLYSNSFLLIALFRLVVILGLKNLVENEIKYWRFLIFFVRWISSIKKFHSSSPADDWRKNIKENWRLCIHHHSPYWISLSHNFGC